MCKKSIFCLVTILQRVMFAPTYIYANQISIPVEYIKQIAISQYMELGQEMLRVANVFCKQFVL